MSFNFKRSAAAAAAIICTASMCACSVDNGYIMKIDGTDIRTGIYLSYMMSAYDNSISEISDAKEDMGDTSEVGDVFTQSIGGKESNEWIKEETLKLVKRHIAIDRLFESKNLSLTNEEIDKIGDAINETWSTDSINYFGYTFSVQQLYGTDTMGEYYESIGIGKDSQKELDINNLKMEKLFLSFYDKDGETPVSEDEINTYIKDNFANVKVIELPYDDKYGLDLDKEEDIQAVKDKAQGYLERLQNGESWIDVQYEHDLEVAKNEAAVDAEFNFDKETSEVPEDMDAYIQAAVDKVTLEKADNIEDLETVISKDSSAYDEAMTEFIWALADDGKPTTYEAKDRIYIIARDDITTKEIWKADNNISILNELRTEDFDEMIDALAENYSVDKNDDLINNKYAPNKYKPLMAQ